MRMRLLEEGKDSILNRVVVIGLIEKINLNEDLRRWCWEPCRYMVGVYL